MGTGKQYDEEFKKQAIKLAKEIGTKAAADELCIPKGTLGTWVQKARIGGNRHRCRLTYTGRVTYYRTAAPGSEQTDKRT